MGLCGFDNKRPRRVACPVEGCEGQIWIDGGVNSVAVQHRGNWGRRQHTEGNRKGSAS